MKRSEMIEALSKDLAKFNWLYDDLILPRSDKSRATYLLKIVEQLGMLPPCRTYGKDNDWHVCAEEYSNCAFEWETE